MSINKIRNRKGKEKITMLTVYDCLTAKILYDAGIDILLVGDSLGNVIMGFDNTLPVTMEIMVHHVKAVRNGAPDAFIVADMPFLSYGTSIEESVKNAGRFMQECGANAVKLEGGAEFADIIAAINKVGIPVMGHIGFKPQSINKSGLKIAGKNNEEVNSLIKDAQTLEKAGIFSIVIEETTEEAARMITESITIPTIGIGAGKFTDGQVLVVTDMLGLDKNLNLKHNKRFANMNRSIKKAVSSYIQEVQSGTFPAEENTFHM
jgi:3-methyl-2-oxobutanoate hydroxymethyltransferase